MKSSLSRCVDRKTPRRGTENECVILFEQLRLQFVREYCAETITTTMLRTTVRVVAARSYVITDS